MHYVRATGHRRILARGYLVRPKVRIKEPREQCSEEDAKGCSQVLSRRVLKSEDQLQEVFKSECQVSSVINHSNMQHTIINNITDLR